MTNTFPQRGDIYYIAVGGLPTGSEQRADRPAIIVSNDIGFTTRRATEQDLKRMLGVYFEQNFTTEKFEDYDGDRWVIVGE